MTTSALKRFALPIIALCISSVAAIDLNDLLNPDAAILKEPAKPAAQAKPASAPAPVAVPKPASPAPAAAPNPVPAPAQPAAPAVDAARIDAEQIGRAQRLNSSHKVQSRMPSSA